MLTLFNDKLKCNKTISWHAHLPIKIAEETNHHLNKKYCSQVICSCILPFSNTNYTAFSLARTMHLIFMLTKIYIMQWYVVLYSVLREWNRTAPMVKRFPHLIPPVGISPPCTWKVLVLSVPLIIEQVILCHLGSRLTARDQISAID